ncbi:MAG: hypothetical protein ACJ763_12680 [Bdellovibrionia bacterium]
MRPYIGNVLVILGVLLAQSIGFAADSSKQSGAAALDAFEKLLKRQGVTYKRSWSTSKNAEVVEILPGSSDAALDRFSNHLKSASHGRLFYCPACLGEVSEAFADGKDVYIGRESAAQNRVDEHMLHAFKSAHVTRQVEQGRGPILGVTIEARDGVSLTFDKSSIHSKMLAAKDMAGYGLAIRSLIPESKALFLGNKNAGLKIASNLSLIREVAQHGEEVAQGLTSQLFHFLALIHEKKPWAFQYVKETSPGSPAVLHFATFDSEYGKLKVPLSASELKLYEAGKTSELQDILVKKLTALRDGAQASSSAFDLMVKDIKSKPANIAFFNAIYESNRAKRALIALELKGAISDPTPREVAKSKPEVEPKAEAAPAQEVKLSPKEKPALEMELLQNSTVHTGTEKSLSHEPKVEVNVSQSTPSLKSLESEIGFRLSRVEEFKFIKQEASKLGVRAWLFGGTAAGYAHYVKWDMLREKGDPRFQKDRFDYDYTNIYRSTQDLDIVIDGNPEQAAKLQAALQAKYPHLQGNKTAWEVRLLTQDMGDKQAILNNPDFMNQHTDSNSTGMIEITQPRSGELAVRDVRDWNSKEPHFLKDVHDGALHYYFSTQHETTKFAKEGRNPPIVSAIRFLTKAFQYELKIRPEDLALIKKIIQEFDLSQTAKNDYVAKWIEKNGKKLIQNAVNIEYAWDTLEKLGLRKKLQDFKGDVKTAESLAWWMSKEPLRTKPIGQGPGKTAKELGLDTVAHETKSFLAYESITRAHTGDPNVLISREGFEGEGAAFGDGFYTKVGREGAVGTGLTIRFRLDPQAREGSDFHRANQGDYILVTNKAALKVIPESLNVSPVEYFKLLAQNEFKASDGAILEKLRRRIGAKLQVSSNEEIEQIRQIVGAEVQRVKKLTASAVLKEWFAMPVSRKYPEYLQKLMNKGTSIDREVIEHVLSQDHWVDYGDLVLTFLRRNDFSINRLIIENVLSKPSAANHPEWIEHLFKTGDSRYYDPLAEHVFSQSHWGSHPKLLEKLIHKSYTKGTLKKYVFNQPHWQSHPQLISSLIEHGLMDSLTAFSFMTSPEWDKHPEWIEKLLQKGTADRAIAYTFLTPPRAQDRPEWLETIVKRPYGMLESDLNYVLSQPRWKDDPELRRLARGADPTAKNLRKAFERGETWRKSDQASSKCISENLREKLM